MEDLLRLAPPIPTKHSALEGLSPVVEASEGAIEDEAGIAEEVAEEEEEEEAAAITMSAIGLGLAVALRKGAGVANETNATASNATTDGPILMPAETPETSESLPVSSSEQSSSGANHRRRHLRSTTRMSLRLLSLLRHQHSALFQAASQA